MKMVRLSSCIWLKEKSKAEVNVFLLDNSSMHDSLPSIQPLLSFKLMFFLNSIHKHVLCQVEQ